MRDFSAGKHVALVGEATRCLLRNPVRSAMVVIALVATLSPLVTALAVCEGVKHQYSGVVNDSADVYVARDYYGSNHAIELTMATRLAKIQGVTAVVPRTIGRTYVKGKFMAILGISSQFVPRSIHLVQGRKPAGRGEVMIGRTAAEYLDVKLGSRFSLKRNPELVFEVVGFFQSPFTIWNADLLVMSSDDASAVFGMRNRATDMLVFTRPGYQQIVDIIIRMSDEDRQLAQPPLRVQTKQIISRYSQRGFNIKSGVFAGFYALVLGLTIPSIGVISGFGLSARRREIGVIKALGWQTQEVLEMIAMENFILSLISVPLTIFVAWTWIHVFNGIGIARFIIADLDIIIPFQIPSELFPVPCALGGMLAVILTMVGSIYSTWRTAIVPPSEIMKA